MFTKPKNEKLANRAIRISDCSNKESDGDWSLVFQLKCVGLALVGIFLEKICFLKRSNK